MKIQINDVCHRPKCFNPYPTVLDTVPTAAYATGAVMAIAEKYALKGNAQAAPVAQTPIIHGSFAIP